jgi:L-threonylcarbamoyladenylate synthase
MKTTVLKLDPVNPDAGTINEASEFIKDGRIVVFPTETVYGIGADALNEAACKRIFEVKGRPSDNPLIVHVSSLDMAAEIGRIPKKYLDVLKRVWPSPITVIVKSSGKLSRTVTGGLDTVAIRMPAHPVALALIKQSGTPIAAPSANPSKKPTATSAKQAINYFNRKVDCIIDAGRAFFGVESTVIDLDTFTILRPGPFTPDEIEKAFGEKPKIGDVSKGYASTEKAISPGTKYAHYAPDTKLLLFGGTADGLIHILDNIENLPPFAFIGSSESCELVSKAFGCSTVALGGKRDMYGVAKNLYDGLIALDSLRVEFGIIESFSEEGIGLAIMNRIRKACSNRSFDNEEELSKVLEP